MKKILLFLFVSMLTVATLFAQAPQKMSYQAVVRNANNTLVTNQNVSARISILQGGVNGTPVYVETHNATTNINGLLTIEVGEGTVVSGTMGTINWASGPYYLKSEIDPNGGVNYSIEGTQQLMSVPYALYANAAGNVPAIAVAPVDSGYVLTITYPGTQPQTYFLANGGTPGPQGPQGDPGQPGLPGADGVGIDSIAKTATNGLVDTYTIYFSNNTTSTYTITNGDDGAPGQPGLPGADGVGIDSIAKTATSGLVDTYTIYFNNNTTSTFNVTNGADGQGGGSGSGQPGLPGADGVGIDSIAKTASNGLVDTYTIYYNNNTTSTYTVTNGADGTNGTNGVGIDSISGPQSNANVDTYTIHYTDGNTSTFTVTNGTNGTNGFSPTITVSTGSAGTTITVTDASGTHQYPIPTSSGGGSGGTLVQQQVDWNETNPAEVTYILNKPNLAAVATSGDYNDLSNKPTIPAEQVNADWNAISGKAQILNKPTLSTVATTGSYNDLSDKPTIPAAASDGQLTISRNGTPVGTFTANQAGNSDVNILVPTTTGELTNDAGFITSAAVPTMSVAQTDTGYVLTVTQPGGSAQQYILRNGQEGAPGTPGTPGDPGAPGTPAPIPSFTHSMNADSTILTITVTVGDNTQSWQIPVGAGGSGGTQLNADWLSTSGVTEILNKPTIGDATVTIQKNGTTVDNFTLNQTTDKTINITVPTQTSELTNNSGFLTTETDPTVPAWAKESDKPTYNYSEIQGTPDLSGYLTSETDPTVNDATITIQKNGVAVDNFTTNQSSDKNINILVPTKTSDLTNDAGFISSYTETDPTVNNATITIKQDGTVVGSFTANEGADQVIDITSPTVPTVNNATITIQKNGTTVDNFTLNQSTDKTINIEVPDVSELQIQSISNDTIYFTNGNYAVMSADWNNVLNKPDFAVVAYSNDYNDLSNKPTTLSQFTDDMGYITSADIPSQQQSDWNEEDATSSAYIHNKPNLNDYASVDTLNNFVTKTENETVGGDKTFTGYTTFEGTWSDFYSQAEFYDYVYFDEWVGFYENVDFEDLVNFKDKVVVSNINGGITVPSVLDEIGTDGTLVVEDNFNDDDCHNAVNFCDLQTVYNDIQNKMQNKLNELADAFNDQVDDLLDSIAKLNDKLNTPKDGEACPTTPTVTDVSGNTYATIRIGNQCWMRENMRASRQNNYTSITSSTSTTIDYGGGTTARYTFPDVTNSSTNYSTYNTQYGKLYNYKAATTICPDGWRLPSSADWKELKDYVKAQSKYYYNNTSSYFVKSLAFTQGWAATSSSYLPGGDQTSNNTTGFAAKPAGVYANSINNGYNIFYSDYAFGTVAAFWTTDKKPAAICYDSQHFRIGGSTDGVGSYTVPDSVFMSVRCIRSNSNGEANTIPSPTVETYDASKAVTNLTTTSATLKAGRVVSDGDMTPLTGVQKAGYVRSNVAGTFNDATLRLDKPNVTTGANVNTISSFPYELSAINLTNLISNTRYYYRVYAISNQNDTVYGAVKSFKTESNEKACTSIGPNAENITDASSNVYPTVAVGSQCWLASNMRITKYADGTSLASSDYKTTSGGLTNYGYEYTYNAAMRGTYLSTGNVQGICPANWHMPSAEEWSTMKSTMEGTAAYLCNSTSGAIAKAMASKSGWTTSSATCVPGNDLSANNTSGFNAYPNGYYNGTTYYSYGTHAYWWYRGGYSYLVNSYAYIYSNNVVGQMDYKGVRCVYGGNYAPAVSTGASSSISVKTATLAGTVNSVGTGSITARGICYATSDNPTIANSVKVASGTSTGSYSVNLTGLTANTTYYYRAYATNGNGTSYGQVKSFTTQTGKTVANYSGYSQELTQTGVRVGGTISNGEATENVTSWGFYLYEKQSDGSFSQVLDAYGSNTTIITEGSYNYKLNSTPQSGSFSMNINGLEPGTTYKYKAQIQTDLQGWLEASSYSAEFTTLADPELTMVSAVYSGSGNTFTYTGNVTKAGNPAYVERGFVMSTATTTPVVGGSNTFSITASGTGTGTFTRSDTWSNPNVSRYVRAYAKKSDGTYVYSSNHVAFTTPNVPGIGFTGNYEAPAYYSTNVSQNSIKLMTYVSTDGNSPLTDRGMVYTTSASVSSTTPSSANVSTNASDAGTKWVKVSGSVNAQVMTLTGLSANTTYYIKSYASNAFGTGYSSATKTVKTALNCGQTLTDQDDYTYATVKIGTQCWMKSNLKAKHYDNYLDWPSGIHGTTISLLSTGDPSNMSTTARYIYYPAGNSSNYGTYGYLYNWSAATGYGVTSSTFLNMGTYQSKNQGICPRGWHIPTNAELVTLNSSLNTTSNFSAFSPSYAGFIMATTGDPTNFNVSGYLWSCNDATNPTYIWINSNLTHGINTYSGLSKAGAASVRCVQDIAY